MITHEGRGVVLNGRPRSSRRDIVTLGVMVALALAILAYWTLGRARRRLERDAVPLPGEESEILTVEDPGPITGQGPGRRGPDGAAAGGAAGETPGAGDGVRDLPPDDADWLVRSEIDAEAERAKFLPALETFTPLEPDALRAFRAIMQDRVPGGYRPKLVPPGESEERVVVDADPAGAVLESPDGGKTELAWDGFPIAEAYRIALEMTPPETADARARDLVYLAQLATLAGKGEEASAFRAKAAVLHFRARLAEKGVAAPDAGPEALYEAARALVDPSAPEADPAAAAGRDARAVDLLHLSRLAASAGRAADATRHAARAVELDPLLEDELEGGVTRSLDLWLLENASWTWDPDDTSTADVRTANDLAGDAKAILHVYRYMRTLGPERLDLLAEPEPSYTRFLKLPRRTRGRAYRIECGLIRPHMDMRLVSQPGAAAAGIRDLEFLFLSAKDAPGGIYLVSAPLKTSYRKGDFLSVTGVYLRRWPFQKPNGKWRWIPWIVASKIEKIELRGAKGWGAFIYVLLGLGAAGAVALLFAARREWRNLTTVRDHLHTRRRAGRDLIRRKVAGATRAPDDKSGPPPAGEPEGEGPPGPDGSPSEPGAGRPPVAGGSEDKD